MIKRLISVLIIVSTLLCLHVSVSADVDFYEDSINVCHNGEVGIVRVLVDDKGTAYGANYWIGYFGRYAVKETDTTLEYYYKGQEKLAKFAKRIFIDKTTGEYKICVYRGESILDIFLDGCADYIREYIESQPYSDKLEAFIKKNYKKDYNACVEEFKSLNDGFKVLEEGKFSSLIAHEGAVWMPIEELLPLLGTHVDVSNGALQIKNVTTSIWQALYGFDMDELEFVAEDELFGEEITTPLAWVTTTLADWRFDRLDVIDKSGDINDYKDIFKSYLLDDEVYLESFGGEDDIVAKKNNEWTGYLKEICELSDGYDFFQGAIEFDMEVFQVISFNTTGVVEAINESAGIGITGDILKFSSIIGSYVYTYMNQVSDHRDMLMMMYEQCFAQSGESAEEISERRGCPSYKAAADISNTYSGEFSNLREAIIEEAKNEFDTKVIKDIILGKMKPAIVIFDTVVGIMKIFGDYGELEDMAHGKKVDKICKTAVDCLDYAMTKNDYSRGSLNRIRLMGLMSALSSRNAYKTYAYWQEDKIKALEDHMRDLYMAAESMPFCDKSYVEDTAKLLKSKYKDLPLLEKDNGVSIDKNHYECYEFIEMNLDYAMKLQWDRFESRYDAEDNCVYIKAAYGASYLEMYATMTGSWDDDPNYKFDPKDFSIVCVEVPEDAPEGSYIAYGIRKGMTYDEMAELLKDADMKKPMETYEAEDTSTQPPGTVKYGYIYPKNCYGVIYYFTSSVNSYKITSMIIEFDPWV